MRAEDLDIPLRIEAIRMQAVLNDEAAWKLERGAIEQEVAQDVSSPEYRLYTRLLAALFKGTPYAHDGLGTVESFEKTTAAMLAKFHDTWYAPNNAILVIAGGVEPAKVMAQVKALFAGIPARPLPPRPTFQFQPVTPETATLPTDRSTGSITIAFRLPGSNSPDFAASVVMADALSSERGRLHDLVVTGKALATGFSIRVLPEASMGMAFASFPRGADQAALRAELERVLNEEKAQGVAPDLIQAAKRHETTDAEFRKNSVSGLASAWSRAVAVDGRRSPDDDVEAVKKVSVDEVNAAARRYLDLGHAIVAILEPQSSGKPAAASRFGTEEHPAPAPSKPVALPDWSERALERLSVPNLAIRPIDRTLPNGLRLIVVPESVSDTVSVYGHIRNNADLEAPPGQDGVDQVLEQLFPFGTTSLDRLQFQAALDDIGADESAGTDFSIRALARDFDRAVALLADNELHPALPEPAFKIIQQQLAATVAGRRQSPGYLAARALRTEVFPKNDPALREATPETVSALTPKNVRDYFEHVFRPDLTTIVVVGNVTADVAEATITKHFGAWRATGPKPETVLPGVPPNRASITTVPNTSREQDRVVLAQTVGMTRKDPDYYTLDLGNTILGGGLSGRLYRELRESTGLVYQVGSTVQALEKRTVFIVQYGCDPANVSRARALIERNLREMQTTPVSPAELRRAKGLLLRRIPLSEQSMPGIARGLIFRSTYDLPLDEPIVAARRYLALTADDIKRVFGTHVRPADFVEVTEGPAPK